MAEMPALLLSLVTQPERARTAEPALALQHEMDIVTGKGPGMEHLDAIGSPSGFVCPECRGALWEIDGSMPPRYRCHTGHGFTLRSLQHVQSVATDDALWTAVRALQEKEMLLRHMAARERAGGNVGEAERLERTADEVMRQQEPLRRSLEEAPEPIE
jgi:two-component system chemotaxis response regulator CheB